MKIIGIPLTLLIVLLFFACGSGNQKPSSLFTIELEGNAKEVRQNDALGVSLKNIKNKEIESVIYSIDGNELPLVNDQFGIFHSKIGQ